MLIKLTTIDNNNILIGTESIISVEPRHSKDNGLYSLIQSRGAMIYSVRVTETIEEIYKLTQPIDIETLNAKIFNLQEQLKVAKEVHFKK